jgi:toxin ParE1/3/4
VNRARFIAAAREEFLAEVAYYEAAQDRLGGRFTTAVEQALARALLFPEAGPPGIAGTRRVHVRGFPFAIVYRSDAQGIVVIAVAHHARRPGYWRSRSG